MIYLRKAQTRGAVDFGWLQSKHSFSFGHYYDPKHMGFSALRVINDDVVKAGRGFETHGHRDMEIISYVVKGALKHKDNTGNEYIVPAGDIQVMSAGKGIMHSEFNPSDSELVNFLQIWIVPNEKGGEPGYAQKTFGYAKKADGSDMRMELLVSSDGRDNTLKIKQDAAISRLQLEAGDEFSLSTQDGKGYLHIVSGSATVSVGSEDDSVTLSQGDAIGVYEKDSVDIKASSGLVALWFDLPSAF